MHNSVLKHLKETQEKEGERREARVRCCKGEEHTESFPKKLADYLQSNPVGDAEYKRPVCGLSVAFQCSDNDGEGDAD